MEQQGPLSQDNTTWARRCRTSMLSDQHKSESRRAAFGFYPVLNLASSRVVISRLKATVVTTFTPYCLFLFFSLHNRTRFNGNINCAWIYSLCLFHTLTGSHAGGSAGSAGCPPTGLHFQLFLLNVRARETCMKRFCVSLHMSRSQPVIVVLSFFCLFDIL